MNAKVEEFIKSKKEEIETRKKEHLISLGLIDYDAKCIKRVYTYQPTTTYSKYDPEKELYYYEVASGSYTPIEVTDEEYQEILKYAPIKEENHEKTSWGKIIEICAKIFFVIILLSGIICMFIVENFSPLIVIVSYCMLFFPMIMGFSKIVAAAEKKL